jgi:uncharacterized protein with HEPN domain
MNGRIPDKVRLQHILDAITNIENFSAGKTKDHLYSDLMYRSSIERNLKMHMFRGERSQVSGTL